jgi:hypothetical protein
MNKRTCTECWRAIIKGLDGNLCHKCLEKKKFYGDKYYDTADMATLLGISEEQVRRRAHGGNMPSRVPHVKRLLWPKTVVDEWLSNRKYVDEARAKYARAKCKLGDHSWMKNELYADFYVQDADPHHTCHICSFCGSKETIFIGL